MIVDAGAKTKAAEAFETLAQIVSRRELPTAPVKGKPAAPTGAPAKKGGSILASLFSKKR
jgi:pilus assembly protein CpaE